MRFVLSTVGTSILTNLIDNNNPDESIWRNMLRDSANLTQDELEPEAKMVINTLAERVLDKLIEDDVRINRRVSAELNGIYGIYGGQLPENSNDEHCLICTDTAQGQETGRLIQDFLQAKGFNAHIYTPTGLSTQGPDSFTNGAKELIKWLADNIPQRRANHHHVIFNLVGGFKSLQGYMNTFGTFYADEVIYIFEAPTADLIKIPCLPIQIDTTVIENHRVQFALMDAGHLYSVDQVGGIPETLLEFVQGNGNTHAGLSEWGQLVWNQTKEKKPDLLTEELLDFPRLEYATTFCKEFRGQADRQARLKLQETLAKVSYLLEMNNGDRTPLMDDGGLQFGQLTNADGIYKFRINRAVRVSCSVSEVGLVLRHYGLRNDVYLRET